MLGALEGASAIEGASVLDLFAGTGALGIEALSRGALSARFIERDAAALKALSENLERLGLGPPEAQIVNGDALGELREAGARGRSYDLVFLDPPYGQALELGPELAALLPALLAPGAHVVLESARQRPLSLPLTVERERTYRDTSITIYSQR